MNKKIFPILILFVTLFGFSYPNKIFAAAEFQSFSASLSFSTNCQPTLTYSVSITPSSIVTGNNFFVSVNPLDSNGQVINQTGGTSTNGTTSSNQDHAVSVPANGSVSNQTVNIIQSINVLTTYRVRMHEYSSTGSFLNSSSFVDVTPTQGTCPPQNTSGQNLNSDNLELEYTEIEIDNPISIDSIPELIQKVFEALIKIGIPLLVVMIVYSGWLYLFARGNPGEIKKAHDMFLYTLIGGAILLAAWALAQLIHSTLIDLTASIVKFFV